MKRTVKCQWLEMTACEKSNDWKMMNTEFPVVGKIAQQELQILEIEMNVS